MSKELENELKRITRAQSSDSFRRDHYLIPTASEQLARIDRMLKKLSELPVSKNQAE